MSILSQLKILYHDRDRLPEPAEHCPRHSANTLSLREMPFVEAARAMGMSEMRIALRHIRLGRDNQDGTYSVLSGLSVGERVAVDPIAAGVLLKDAAKGKHNG